MSSMNETIISWATHTLNVVHGCSKPPAMPEAAWPTALDRLKPGLFEELYPDGAPAKWVKPNTSPECARCYAEHLSNRRHWTPKPWLEENAKENVQLHPERFREFHKLRPKGGPLAPPSQRTRIFVCSMGDWAHRLVPDSFIREMLHQMGQTDHIYMCLTMRPERAWALDVKWPENVWVGTTSGHPVTKWRIEYLRRIKCSTRFISMEPLLASMLPVNLEGIHQVIVGGEGGHGFRPMRMEWARELRDLCAKKKVAFFYKQAAAFITETAPYLVEQDGRCMEYRQFPGELCPPRRVLFSANRGFNIVRRFSRSGGGR